jgi:hypothetical protein
MINSSKKISIKETQIMNKKKVHAKQGPMSASFAREVSLMHKHWEDIHEYSSKRQSQAQALFE